MKAPKIKCIYLGKNASNENKKVMNEFGNNNKITIVQL